MHFRIGINLGDVIEQDDGTLYGDGVNIAARLEAIASHGGIAVSGPAHDFLEGRIDVPIFVGEHEVKNIASGTAFVSIGAAPRRSARRSRRATPPREHPSAIPRSRVPCSSVSSDEETAVFATGLTEEILDDLSRGEYYRLYSTWPLRVASRSASLQFTEGAGALSAIAQRLGVHYLLEGSVRRMGSSLRMTAQLTRAEGGFHVWSKSYQREMADGFEMQTQLAQNIAHLATSELLFDVWKRRAFEGAIFGEIDPAAVQHFVNAEYQYRLIRLGEGGDWALYEQLLRRAVEARSRLFDGALDPGVHLHEAARRPIEARRGGGGGACGDRQGPRHPPVGPLTLWQLGEIQLNLDLDYAKAEATFKQVLNRLPSNIWMHYNLATIALREGRARRRLGSWRPLGLDPAPISGFSELVRLASERDRRLHAGAEGLRQGTQFGDGWSGASQHLVESGAGPLTPEPNC